jgi:hypothetical protein
VQGDCMAIQIRQTFIVCGAVLAFNIGAHAAPADACKSILQQFKTVADRAHREVASTLVNLQEAASKVPDDKRRLALIAQSCAASAEAAGVFKTYRIVVAECTADRDPARSDMLDKLDRSISQIRVALDKACR